MNKKAQIAPIALFAYNRPIHIKKTIDSLKKNKLCDKSDLIIFSDGAKDQASRQKVEEVRRYLKFISGFKSVKVIERQRNLGLGPSIISGVTQIIKEYGRVIVMEDDLITSEYFLQYMNDALVFYENENKVISIHGYCYPISELPETFFLRGADCLGWATWKRGWDLFEENGSELLHKIEQENLISRFDLFGAYNFSQMLRDQIAGKNSSWAVRWYGTAVLKNKLTLYNSE
jgi:glycosyltransferase involved in cell wall biosynthesis